MHYTTIAYKTVKFILWILIVIGLISSYTIYKTMHSEQQWQWHMLDYTHLPIDKFDQHFMWGTADSAMQTEGVETVGGKCIQNNWTMYEEIVKNNKDFEPVGMACQRWSRYKEDIALFKQLGMNTFRFSIEWAKIEPEKGKFDLQALQHYSDFMDELLKNNIQPIPTLWHYTWPLWFEKKGGFEREENINDFVEFATFVFNHLHNKTTHWITFNQPIGFVIKLYFLNQFKLYDHLSTKNRLRLTGVVVKNMLAAHTMLYKHFKESDPSANIGMAKIYYPIYPYHTWNPIEYAFSSFLNYLLHDVFVEYFNTGNFNWCYLVKDYHKDAPGSLDFLGINYYGRAFIKQDSSLKLKMTSKLSETAEDLAPNSIAVKVMYPEGLYHAIVKFADLGKPLIITENGFSTRNDAVYSEFIKRHLYVVSRALNEGYPIHGYLLWTLVDSYSWTNGYFDKHGIYSVDFTTQERKFNPSAQVLVDTVNQWHKIHALA